MTEAEWAGSTNPTLMLEFLRDKTSDRKLWLTGLACLGYPRPFSDPRVTEFADAIALFAEGEADFNAVLISREIAISEPCIAGSPLSTYDLEVLCLDDFAKAVAGDALYGLLRGLRTRRTNPVIGRWVRPGDWSKSFRDIFGNPFRPVTLDPSWLTSTVLALADGIYAERAFDRLPILADALQDAGCENPDVLDHCRGPGPHVRGCFVVDLLMGRE